MKNLVIRWFKVDEDEFAQFFWMTALLLFIRAASILLNNYAETAFLKRFGVEYLPLMTAVNAVVTFILMSLLGSALVRGRGDRLIGRCLIAFSLVVGLMRFVVPLDLSLVYPFLYILKSQLDVLLVFLFWNLANDLFSTRQSKRLFPLITAGGIVGGIAGSSVTPLIAQLVSLDNLLLVFPLLSLAAVLSAWRLGRAAPGDLSGKDQQQAGDRRSLLQEFKMVGPLIRSSTLAQVLLVLTLLPNVVIPILNYQFNFVVNQTFPSEAGMLSFYSYFRGAQNLISLLLILFVGRIYGRFGLPVALMFHPFNYLISFFAYLFQFNIFSAIYAGTSVGVLRRTINGPATTVLYGLLKPESRAILRPFLRGTVVRCGILIGAGIVWGGTQIVHPRYLSVIAIGLVAVWLAATVLLKRRYSLILLDLIRGKLPDFYRMNRRDLQNLFRGVDVGPVLLERFRKSEGDEALWYAEALHTNKVAGLDDAILERLPELDTATCVRLLPFLEQPDRDRMLAVFGRLADPGRSELLIALSQTVKRILDEMPVVAERRLFARATDPEVKACLVGWMKKEDPAGLKRLLDNWLDSENLAERRAAVVAIRDQRLDDYADVVYRLLDSEEDPSLLALGLHALADFDFPDRADRVRPFLRHAVAQVRAAALESLPLSTEKDVQSLIPLLGDFEGPIRKAAIRRLSGLARPLQPLLVDAMGSCSRRVLDGLFQVLQALEIDELDMVRFCRRQVTEAYRLVDLARWLEGTPACTAQELLLIHLEELRQQRVENVIRGLAARDESGQIDTILHGLAGQGREREDSLEALESLVDQRLWKILLPLLENWSTGDRLKAGNRFLRHLDPSKSRKQAVGRLLREENAASVILTLEMLHSLGQVETFRSRIEEVVNSDNEFVAAMAVGVLSAPKEEVVNEENTRMDLPERMMYLRKVDLFQDLPVNELTAVAMVAGEAEFVPDTLILGGSLGCRGGHRTCDCLHILVSGEVAIEQQRSDGETVVFAQWGAGQTFGLAALFGVPEMSLRVRAITDVLVLQIFRQDFTALCKEFPEIPLRLCQVLAVRLGGVVDELSRVAQDCKQGNGEEPQSCTGHQCGEDEEK